MIASELGKELGRLFEVGFNIGMLAYIEQNQLSHRFGNLYRQDLQQLSFPKMLRRLADSEMQLRVFRMVGILLISFQKLLKMG